MKYFTRLCQVSCFILMMPVLGFGATLFQENFDDANLTSRGWYDGAGGTISKTEYISGSTGSFECRFTKGASGCSAGAPRRHLFTPTNQVYLSYWIKHSSNWIGSGVNYHPHVMYFLTNLNGSYEGLAYDRLTAYVEETLGYPVMEMQDGQNIDESKIGVNLIGVTENRAVSGCNGTQPNIGQRIVSCYVSGNVHWNGTQWYGSTPYFFDPVEKVKWHHVEAYIQLNTVSNGIGQPDGIVRYWYDGKLEIDHSNVILRTGKNPTMLFNQFVVAPYIGVGSPADQTFWIDNLTVGTSRPMAGISPPSAPGRLRTQ